MATNIAFLLLLLVAAFPCSLAQPSADDYDTRYRHYNTRSFSPGIAVLIVFLVAFLFAIVFFSLYISRTTSVDRTAVAPVPTVHARRGGLDPTIIETFPTLPYSEVVHLKTDKGPLECAVCLCEFSTDELLRMLPRCCHVFHPECIDAWLAGHKTCPVCRADLSVPAAPEEVVIPVAADAAIDLSKIGRSNTIAVADRFTLRLPDHVRREIVMKRSASVAAAFPAKGESGSRRGRPDRWGSFVRTLSLWRTGDGEGTSSDSRKERRLRSSSKVGSNDQPSSSASGTDAHV